MLREHCGREEKIKELEDQKLCCEVVISRNVGSLFIKSSQYACSNISYKRVTPIEMSKWGLNTKEELLETLLFCTANIILLMSLTQGKQNSICEAEFDYFCTGIGWQDVQNGMEF